MQMVAESFLTSKSFLAHPIYTELPVYYKLHVLGLSRGAAVQALVQALGEDSTIGFDISGYLHYPHVFC